MRYGLERQFQYKLLYQLHLDWNNCSGISDQFIILGQALSFYFLRDKIEEIPKLMAARHSSLKGGKASKGIYAFSRQRKNTAMVRKDMQPCNSKSTLNFRLARVDFPVCGLSLCWSGFDLQAAWLHFALPRFAVSGVCWPPCTPSHPPVGSHIAGIKHFLITMPLCAPS